MTGQYFKIVIKDDYFKKILRLNGKTYEEKWQQLNGKYDLAEGDFNREEIPNELLEFIRGNKLDKICDYLTKLQPLQYPN